MTSKHDRLTIKVNRTAFENSFTVLSDSGEPIPLPDSEGDFTMKTSVIVPLQPPKDQDLAAQGKQQESATEQASSFSIIQAILAYLANTAMA